MLAILRYILIIILIFPQALLAQKEHNINTILDDDEFLEELSSLSQENELQRLRVEREMQQQEEEELRLLQQQEDEERELENILAKEDEELSTQDSDAQQQDDGKDSDSGTTAAQSSENPTVAFTRFQDQANIPNMARTREPYNFLRVQQPDFINKFHYQKQNEHLPPATSLQQYTDLLFLAAVKDDLNAVKALVDRGADMNAINQINGQSALFYAYKSGSWRVLEFLAHHGANVDLQDIDGNTVLHLAAQAQNLELVQLLLDFKASPIINNKQNITPFELLNEQSKLHFASIIAQYPELSEHMILLFIKNNNLRLLREVLHDNVDLNKLYKDGETPLTFASKMNNLAAIKILLNAGANHHFKNKTGISAYEIASQTKRIQQLRLYKTIDIRKQLDSG